MRKGHMGHFTMTRRMYSEMEVRRKALVTAMCILKLY